MDLRNAINADKISHANNLHGSRNLTTSGNHVVASVKRNCQMLGMLLTKQSTQSMFGETKKSTFFVIRNSFFLT
jgi:hypothetical protein